MGYKITKEKLRKACKGTNGIKTKIAENLGVDRTSLWYYLQRHPEQQYIIEEEKNKLHDFVESRILRSIKEGDAITMRWFADRQMQHRGYGKRTKTEISGGFDLTGVYEDLVSAYEEVQEETVEK